MWGGAQRGTTAACFPYYYCGHGVRLSNDLSPKGGRLRVNNKYFAPSHSTGLSNGDSTSVCGGTHYSGDSTSSGGGKGGSGGSRGTGSGSSGGSCSTGSSGSSRAAGNRARKKKEKAQVQAGAGETESGIPSGGGGRGVRLKWGRDAAALPAAGSGGAPPERSWR